MTRPDAAAFLQFDARSQPARATQTTGLVRMDAELARHLAETTPPLALSFLSADSARSEDGRVLIRPTRAEQGSDETYLYETEGHELGFPVRIAATDGRTTFRVSVRTYSGSLMFVPGRALAAMNHGQILSTLQAFLVQSDRESFERLERQSPEDQAPPAAEVVFTDDF